MVGRSCQQTANFTAMLPDEILFRVLWQVCFADPRTHTLFRYIGRSDVVCGLLCVCARWNRVLSSNHRFWASSLVLATSGARWEFCIRRSGGSSLDVCSAPDISLHSVEGVLSRARSLEVTADDVTVQWNSILTGAGVLDNLLFLFLDRPHLRDFNHCIARINAPRLLECSIDCNATLNAPALRVLHITDVFDDATNLKALLGNLPSLQELVIELRWTGKAHDWTDVLCGLKNSVLTSLSLSASSVVMARDASPVSLPRASRVTTNVPVLFTTQYPCDVNCCRISRIDLLRMLESANNIRSLTVSDLWLQRVDDRDLSPIVVGDWTCDSFKCNSPLDDVVVAILRVVSCKISRTVDLSVEFPLMSIFTDVADGTKCYVDIIDQLALSRTRRMLGDLCSILKPDVDTPVSLSISAEVQPLSFETEMRVTLSVSHQGHPNAQGRIIRICSQWRLDSCPIHVEHPIPPPPYFLLRAFAWTSITELRLPAFATGLRAGPSFHISSRTLGEEDKEDIDGVLRTLVKVETVVVMLTAHCSEYGLQILRECSEAQQRLPGLRVIQVVVGYDPCAKGVAPCVCTHEVMGLVRSRRSFGIDIHVEVVDAEGNDVICVGLK